MQLTVRIFIILSIFISATTLADTFIEERNFVVEAKLSILPKIPVMSIDTVLEIRDSNYEYKFSIRTNNLVDFIWNRSMKTQNTNKIFMLEQKYCGLSFEEKLKKLLMFLKNKNADTIFIQNSESVSWLFNIRGADLLYTPITFAYSLISKKYIYILGYGERR